MKIFNTNLASILSFVLSYKFYICQLNYIWISLNTFSISILCATFTHSFNAWLVLVECLWENIFFCVVDKSVIEYFNIGIILLNEICCIRIWFWNLLLKAFLLNRAKIRIVHVEIDEGRIIL